MFPVTLGELAVWAGTSCPDGCHDLRIGGVSDDTRTLRPGRLFVALRGERFDGHEYVEKAYENGAAALLVDRDVPGGLPCLRASDTLTAYLAMAGGYRRRFHFPVAALTGSVGKTTTKEMTAAILATQYNTFKTPENKNNAIGASQSMFSLHAQHEAAVFELGMNHAGEIAPMARAVAPDVAAIVNVGVMHIENLGSREAIARAKREILDGLKPGGTAILDGDAVLLRGVVDLDKHRLIRFGYTREENDFHPTNIETHTDSVTFTLHTPGGSFLVRLPVPGRHNVTCAMAAAAIAWVMGIREEGIVQGLASFKNAEMRTDIYPVNGLTIIEDCYNAGPESMAAALAILAERPETGRKIAVLGEMLELGPIAAEEHEKLRALAEKKADAIFLYGERWAPGVTHEALAETVRRYAKPGDVLLFKGSRGMRMEKALALFLEG
jgi:UDP-N-acetylmuramoyl-tripeptide--D-alanyl-D-alanine ligase